MILDGGIRRGVHIVKALASGADCCTIGRAQLWGLAVGGEAGVAHAFDILRRELDLAMGLCGLADVAAIGPEVLARPPRAAPPPPEAPASGNGAGEGAEDIVERVPETGGPAGPEPTRYGDWERKGRAIDF